MKLSFLISLFALLAIGIACGLEDSDSAQNSATDENEPEVSSAAPEAGTQTDSEPEETDEDEDDDEAEGVKISSIYTDLAADKCKTIESDEEGGFSVQSCPGTLGYKLEVTEGDLRQSVTVIDPNGKRYDLEFTRVVSGAFSAVGEKAEWRFREEGGDKTPFALIIRFNASENPEKPEQVTSYLTVSKLTNGEVCVTDIVRPIRNANIRARELAEKAADNPCIGG